MSRKEDSNSYNKEISNNILVLILIVIIFVSVLGTMIVKQTVDTMKSIRSESQQRPLSPQAGTTGMVMLTILPSEQEPMEADS